MPELPELQAHAERLDEAVRQRTLTDFRPLTFTSLKTATPDPALTHGHPVTGVSRRGKYLVLGSAAVDPAGQPISFVVHLMQGGRLEPDEKQAAKPRGGLARWRFDDGSALLLTEPGSERRAGVWVVAGDPDDQPPIAGLGPDADTVSRATLAALLADHPMRVHGFLRDQRLIAGVGRRLANEVCHRARLSPFASTAKLDADQVDRLHQALGACIAESLDEERGRDALSRAKDRTSAVHNQVGAPCPVCADTVRSVEYRAYTVAYCPTCQTGGKALADNTTSKFLK